LLKTPTDVCLYVSYALSTLSTPPLPHDLSTRNRPSPLPASITGDEVHQSTFVGVQTALPTASSASLASLSAQSTASVASTASLAMASIISVGTGTAYSSIVSASRASESARSTASVGEASMLSTASVGSTSALSASASASRRAAVNGSLQGNGNGAGLPKWAVSD
jgi:hypothetical protein